MHTFLFRLGKISFFAVLFQLLFTSCYKVDLEGFDPVDPNISFPQTQITVSSALDTIELPIDANLPWRVKTDADWLSVVTAQGAKTGKFKVAIARNRVTQSRTATLIGYVTNDSQVTMTITQEAGEPAPDYTRHFYVKISGTDGQDGLSWGSATTLDMALELATNGDFIHIAEGTYVPKVTISGGNTAQPNDQTFEIAQNVHLIGGYPAQATSGSVADPVAHPVLLSGNDQKYHVVTVTAIPEGEHYVSLRGITMTKGHAFSTNSAVTVNGVALNRNYGAGMAIVKSKVVMEDCAVTDNISDQHIPGIFMLGGAHVTIKQSKISNNRGVGNGGGIWNDGSTLYLYDTDVVDNVANGVGGGIYSLNVSTESFNYLYNVTVANNQVGLPATVRVGAGIYSRERSKYIIVSSTIYGNRNIGTGFGAGITAYGGSVVDIINSTISNNEGGVGNSATNGGSGIFNNNSPTANTVNIYNSIVSGNMGAANDIGGANINIQSTIIGSVVYNYDKGVQAGQSFDPTTMFAPFAHYNGGFGKTLPVTAGNPAVTFGMSILQLQILGANLSLDEVYYLKDQNNRSRTGTTVMGAALPQ